MTWWYIPAAVFGAFVLGGALIRLFVLWRLTPYQRLCYAVFSVCSTIGATLGSIGFAERIELLAELRAAIEKGSKDEYLLRLEGGLEPVPLSGWLTFGGIIVCGLIVLLLARKSERPPVAWHNTKRELLIRKLRNDHGMNNSQARMVSGVVQDVIEQD